ncbi:hypothetical protein [Vibrio aestuarianus]|uniref:hypothetical protein n=1 Tax=Vibrio aestuarianus TaxID=28171 RepID=UPI00237D3292|nr:hypothetical protein [Vibrio aestuarianus]MDE1333449.1 hypothetical protein [Vibrio aestuarianus]
MDNSNSGAGVGGCSPPEPLNLIEFSNDLKSGSWLLSPKERVNDASLGSNADQLRPK